MDFALQKAAEKGIGAVSQPEHNGSCCFRRPSDPGLCHKHKPEPAHDTMTSHREGVEMSHPGGDILSHHLQVTSQVPADVRSGLAESAGPRPTDSREIINRGGSRPLRFQRDWLCSLARALPGVMPHTRLWDVCLLFCPDTVLLCETFLWVFVSLSACYS